MQAVRELYDDFIRTFGNVLFAVLLFIVWGLLTLVGVIIAQGKDPATYFDSYAAPLARLILRLDFNNIYHTPYYVGIIGLILLSLTVCTFKRVIPARLPPLRAVAIDKIPLHASFDVVGDPESIRDRMEAFFRARGWNVRKRELGGVEWTFADKHNWARRGVLVAHAGFVIIAAGTTIYWAKGFSGDEAIVTGQTVSVPHTQTSIRLDGFSYKIKPIVTKSGMVYQPIDYVSRVTATGSDGVARTATIRVNHPLDVDGVLYYQSSYGFAMRFRVTHDGVRVPALMNRDYLTGDEIDLPGTQRSIVVAQFVPTVDRLSGQPSADPRINDPAVFLQIFDSGQAAGAGLIPMKAAIDAGGGWRVTPERYLLVSGIQYTHDPGVSLVGIGAFVLLAGLMISFYLLPARLFVRVDPGPEGSRIGLAAMTVKGYDIFERQFNDLAAALGTKLIGDSRG
jgi:cytochrome c biogenesis protein